ncbi:MAG: shikimate kinase [Candidatus Paceibacterota bacterium]|jgi:shikimate kinase
MGKQNITLIGMAGAGKSTVGSILAQKLGWACIDTDKVIERVYGNPLQIILNEIGEEKFREIESSEIKKLNTIQRSVVSTGGSAVYSPDAMALLKDNSTVVYLYADLDVIKKRIDVEERGIIGLKGTTLQQLFEKREFLYKRFADITINTSGKTPSEIADEIISKTLL